MYSRRPVTQSLSLTHTYTHTLLPCLVGSVTQTAAVAATNNNNKNGAGRSQKQQSSRHHYPVPATKSPNYALYNYGSSDAQGHNSMQQQQQLQHRGPTNHNNYVSGMYHHQQQQPRSSPQQGPYITQVTIRDNKHIIQSPNI